MSPTFTLDGIEFGIDTSTLRCQVANTADGRRLLTLDIHGDASLFKPMLEDEQHPFFWALYPPHLYLHDFPVSAGPVRTLAISEADIDDYDIALYMMEHHDISGLTLKFARGELRIDGVVTLWPRQAPLQIRLATDVC